MSYLFTAVIGNLQAFAGYSATPFWVILLIIIILALFFWYGQNRVVSNPDASHGHDAHGEETHGAHDHGEVQEHVEQHDHEAEPEPVATRTAVLKAMPVAEPAVEAATAETAVVEETPEPEPEPTPEPEPEPEPVDVVASEPVEPDNLKKVEGIGPKIERILHEAGIRTFAELAAAEDPQLEKIERGDAGIRIAYPDTWPEQATFAASGDWDGLEKLQDELKGGRRR